MPSRILAAWLLIFIPFLPAFTHAADVPAGAATTATVAHQHNVGDPAPDLKLGTWIKGQPVDKLEIGQVYVVEFWATWCGPCKKMIPHMTELAKKYDGKAKVIGVSIFEAEMDSTKRIASVKNFVTDMGDKMDYRVAADTDDGFMGEHWMGDFGQEGIPSAFIIDQSGKIAWIGYPWAGLDEAIEKVISGTLDPKAVQDAAAARVKAQEAKDLVQELYKPIIDLQKAGKDADAVAALDKMVEQNPAMKAGSRVLRYHLLLAYDPDAAFTLMRELAKGELGRNAGGLYMTSRDLLENPDVKKRNAPLARELAQRSCEVSKFSDPNYLAQLAAATFANGQVDKAVEYGVQAVKLYAADRDASKGSVQYVNRQLERYRAAQKKAATTQG